MLDVVSIMLGTATIVMTFVALINGENMVLHSVVFLLGGFLMLVNTLKNINRKSRLAIAFGVLALIMFAIFSVTLYFAQKMYLN